MHSVLVAGGAGFIGSHICETLLNKGYKVVCLDNLITGNKKNIEHLSQNSNFKFVEQDVTQDLSSLTEDLQDLESVYHFASPASPNKKSNKSYIAFPIETMLVNSLGTYNLLELVKKYDARFLYASSSEVYGDPAISPQKEDYFGNVNPNGIRSVYDEGKRFGEALTMAYVRKHSLNARIVRIFNTYGPNMHKDDGRVVSNFINQTLTSQPLTVYGDGTQTRSLCFVSDLVEGLIKAMNAENTRGEVINLGNPDERKIVELATIIKNLVGSSSELVYEPLPEDDPKKRKPDISKAKDLLGWEPNITLEEGLKKTINYFTTIA